MAELEIGSPSPRWREPAWLRFDFPAEATVGILSLQIYLLVGGAIVFSSGGAVSSGINRYGAAPSRQAHEAVWGAGMQTKPATAMRLNYICRGGCADPPFGLWLTELAECVSLTR